MLKSQVLIADEIELPAFGEKMNSATVKALLSPRVGYLFVGVVGRGLNKDGSLFLTQVYKNGPLYFFCIFSVEKSMLATSIVDSHLSTIMSESSY